MQVQSTSRGGIRARFDAIRRSPSAWQWLVGLLGGALVVGPGLGPGSLLNLDLVLTPRLPVPPGVWGLGPGLPRSIPFAVPMAWASEIVGGPTAGKLLILGSFTLAFVGAARLAAGGGRVAQAGAGALYAFSPFMLTRVGVGHLTLVVAAALLPFALPTLLEPSKDLGRTFLWAAAFGFVGFAGALFAAPAIAVGLVAERGRSALRVVGGFVIAQLPWVIPGLFVTNEGVRLASASNFATDAHGLGGYLRVLAGYGFWDPGQQVSLRLGGAAALIAALLFAFAVIGVRELPREWGRRATALAGIGLVMALGSRAPVLRAGYDAISDTTLGEAIRESQRLLPLYLVWLAPSAALGARRVARAVPERLSLAVAAMPVAMALILAGPGLFGLNGRLEPASFPKDWKRALNARDRAPGTLLALPFSEYVDLPFAGNRRVLTPIPAYFGGDVIFSSDPGLDAPARERADPREPTARQIVRQTLRGDPPSARLAVLGVRWVALLHEENWRDFAAVLRRDPGLQRVTGRQSLELFRVLPWRGPAIDDHGGRVTVDTPVLPLAFLGRDVPATWYRPASDGWLRGLDAVSRTPDGLLEVPAGSGPVWYWPTVVVLAGDALTAAAVLAVLIRRRGRGPALVSTEDSA